ncbi:peroxidasin homolog pxn-1-like [Uloborus diversus]|uniref:peroxidasin homolog pxn-1-like n=1 Tax=Uloborus diversus TaxID=327109 RepID=UPI00240A327E|nr:peroxidasin homolog pxn-1-like [Uloborus diversus]
MGDLNSVTCCIWVLMSTLLTSGMVLIPPKLHDSSSQDYDLNQLNWTSIYDSSDPSSYLALVHDPNEEEFMMHHISRNLLDVTKDLLNYSPRSAVVELNVNQRLNVLQSLQPRDIEGFLSQQAVVIPPQQKLTCHQGTQYYRTFDGSCNNFYNPCWGKTEQPYRRWLQPAYANGVDEPRRRANGFPLPNPRHVYQWVSSQFEQTQETAHPYMSNLVMVWGQLVAHDIVLTPAVTMKVWDGQKFKNEKPNCCDPTTPHPDCMPIMVDFDDSFYTSGHCMNIVRSIAYTYSPNSCSPLKLGTPREQLNQITSFLDASLVYGTSEKEMRMLRENDGLGAKLTMDYSSRWSKPLRKNATNCKSWNSVCDKRCFLTGEKRANENPVLGSLHTIWAREHNRLVDLLRIRGWPEDTLFHVVRKIVGALFQHITYKEYIPLIIGTSLAGAMQLSVPTNNYQYNPTVDPTIFNSFATAAFRYGHSMIGSQTKRRGRTLRSSPFLSQDFFSMDDFCPIEEDPVANLINAQLDQIVQKVDCLFSKQVTNHLFSKDINGRGLDLFSLNIQRGRDHGIPPYNKWRESCGLPKANDYSDLKGIIPDYILERLKYVYGPGQIDEVDLFVGGVSEFPVNDGILGPTFTCIVANQFKNLKFGDRFWYENTNHPGAFTNEQIESIRKTTLASLLCRNSNIQEIQRMAFILPSNENPMTSCEIIVQQADIDINIWQ